MSLQSLIEKTGHSMTVTREMKQNTGSGSSSVTKSTLVRDWPVMIQPLTQFMRVSELIRQVERGVNCTHVIYTYILPPVAKLGDFITVYTAEGEISGVCRTPWNNQAGQGKVFAILIEEASEFR